MNHNIYERGANYMDELIFAIYKKFFQSKRILEMDKAIEENDKKYLLFLLRKESILYESFGYIAIEINYIIDKLERTEIDDLKEWMERYVNQCR